jgi:hypothetical protein
MSDYTSPTSDTIFIIIVKVLFTSIVARFVIRTGFIQNSQPTIAMTIRRMIKKKLPAVLDVFFVAS